MGSYTVQRRWPSFGSGWIKFALLGVVISLLFQGASCDVEPTESQCRSHIEKALKEQHLEERPIEEPFNAEFVSEQEGTPPTDDSDSTEGTITNETEADDDDDDAEIKREGDDDDHENHEEENDAGDAEDAEKDGVEVESTEENETKEDEKDDDTKEETGDDQEEGDKQEDGEEDNDDDKDGKNESEVAENDDDDDDRLERAIDIDVEEVKIDDDDDDNKNEEEESEKDDDNKTAEDEDDDHEEAKAEEEAEGDDQEKSDGDEGDETGEDKTDEKEEDGDRVDETEAEDDKTDEKEEDDGKTDEKEEDDDKTDEKEVDDDKTDEKETEVDAAEEKDDDDETADKKEDEDDDKDQTDEDDDKKEEPGDHDDVESVEKDDDVEKVEVTKSGAGAAESEEADGSKEEGDQEAPEEEELIKEVVIPDNLRPRDHIGKILKLEDSEVETTLEKTTDTTLKSLKGLYDTAIKPLEMLYKYRDLSNRHFGDPEIFSKPLILFMGPWSGGKSSTINYLLDNEFTHISLRTGAEPSPAYFNILMHGEEEEILDGTQLAADWTFSGLQKFGQSLLDRLKGIKLPNKLLEKVNIVEIPGILEIRKQVQRLFPFNDACQWFIDRADIIFLVYDPSKLDVGPETEAILDQLKGREYQTRIILNKADQVKPEELMRVQGTLIWNISPLMSSSEPPIMYSTSLWSLPYEAGAPTRLLQAQERAFLRDLREAIDKRVENKIASARRFAVRVRNHAKMVDCYLTTYYNHKSFFGNRKKISDDIIEYPQKYHIYEGLSTLTNISRYDLPDPDVYKDFFKINPLYEFKKLSETCTYFRGCPINQLDVAIAYDLPELVGRYKKAVEASKEKSQKENS